MPRLKTIVPREGCAFFTGFVWEVAMHRVSRMGHATIRRLRLPQIAHAIRHLSMPQELHVVAQAMFVASALVAFFLAAVLLVEQTWGWGFCWS